MDKFIFMLEWADGIEEMSNVDKGILFQNIINHHKGEPIDTSSAVVNPFFRILLNQYSRIDEKYRTNVENGKKGGAPKGNKNAQKQPKTTEEQPNTTQNNQTTTYKEKEKENVFTSEEVKTNIQEINGSKDLLSSLGGYGKFLGNFPPHKVRDIEEGKLIWDSFSQEEKKEVFRHSTKYISDMIAKGQEQYLKNSINYLMEELWLDMKPREFNPKPVVRGFVNMTFVTYYSIKNKISEDEAQKFLYRTSTDAEFSKAHKEYKLAEQNYFKQNGKNL